MALDTHNLACFLSVYETGSFTEAARRLGRSQSAVTQQIMKLETTLGKTLLRREKPFTLTPDGQTFLHYAEKIYETQCEALDLFKTPDLVGEVKFGLPEDFASVYLSDILVDFARIHPRIQLNVECDLTHNLLARFEEGDYDLILAKMDPRPQDDHCQEIWSEKLVWCGQPHTITDANILPLVLSPEPCVYRDGAIKALNKAEQAWRTAFTSQSHAGKIAAVEAGLGITVLPANMVPRANLQLTDNRLPPLEESHACLLKSHQSRPAIDSLEAFIAKIMHKESKPQH